MSIASEPIVTTGLADELAFRLETEILDGRYPPGTRLPQEELCERFAVSRTPVREALRKLQAKNLVVVVPNKGATVRLLGRKELLDIYDVRAELEGFSCELAAARITDRCITELDAGWLVNGTGQAAGEFGTIAKLTRVAMLAPVVNHLWAFTTHSSPSRVAVASIRVGSEPATSGSVMSR